MKFRVRAADVASVMFMTGVAVQGFGLYALGGMGLTTLVIGTELAILGIVGVFRHA